MAASLQVAIKKLLNAADRSKTSDARGKAFEDLACLIFGSIPGVSVIYRNSLNALESEEIDIVLRNRQHPKGLDIFDPFLLIECKNWSKPVGSSEITIFANKLRNRGLDFGILIAANGITGDPDDGNRAHQQIAFALKDKIRLIVITRADIEKIRSGSDLASMIITKVGQLIAKGTVGP